jgi:ubiquinone/menaquinone biosynthesis C-methylase UbiE
MSRSHLAIMTTVFAVRDLLFPPKEKLEGAGIQPGSRILDYGCGPGGYSLAAAKIVGSTGIVYALDIDPLAVDRVEKIAARKGFGNIRTILSSRDTGLESGTIDTVLLYDIYHDLTNADAVLADLHRILKPDGILSFSDHHLKEREFLPRITQGGYFRLIKKEKRSYTFQKN